jgi:fatty-acyl-CoA synthase
MVLGTLACATDGACVVVPGEAFDPAAVLTPIESERATALYGVPTMFIAELAHDGFERFDLTSLRRGSWPARPAPSR